MIVNENLLFCKPTEVMTDGTVKMNAVADKVVLFTAAKRRKMRGIIATNGL